MMRLMRRNMMWKLMLAFVLMLFVCGTPVTVFAETVGAFEVTGGTNGTDYSYADGVLTILTDTEITIANTDPATSTTDRIVVADGVSANVILNGVNIDRSGFEWSPFEMAYDSNGYVKITLADGTENILTGGQHYSGLQKRNSTYNHDGILEINGSGSLVATGGSGGAGIGSCAYSFARGIIINGGNITAIGGRYAAGIGGGIERGSSNITINGGTVTAIGGELGAGIGGGKWGSGNDITINGGTVTATGGSGGAGIGGGKERSGNKITINGGNVIAAGGNTRGIGCGSGCQFYDGDTMEITITGGTVTAKGGMVGGFKMSGTINVNVIISGGSVKVEDDIWTGATTPIGGIFHTPTLDGVTPVYPLEIYNYPCRDITINGKDYQDMHFDENKIYVYLPAGQEYEVMLGDTKKVYTFSEERKCFVPDVEGFVERMYTVVLNREADVPGLVNWASQLENGSHYASDIAREFVMSPEFELRNLSNREFVDVLYLAFMDRNADYQGRQNWMNQLDAGYSRIYVLSKFVNTEEFLKVCNSNGVKRGIMYTTGHVFDGGVVAFVDRLYNRVLGRNSDEDGLWNWVQNLAAKLQTAEDVAKYFFGSEEYALKNTTDTVYLQDLYSVFMDRAADEAGIAYWEFVLSQGFTRDYVLSEFAKSEEFKAIAASYGLE